MGQFTWITMLDDKVRDTHKALHGRVFDDEIGWNGLFPSNMNGKLHDYNCRCIAEKVIGETKGLNASGDTTMKTIIVDFNGTMLAMLPEVASRLSAEVPSYIPGSSLYKVEDGKAIIQVKGQILHEGTALSYGMLIKSLAQAEQDTSVSSIRLEIDSPGGLITGLFHTAKRIENCSKPTEAYVVGECCSAAYWLASACNKIVAVPTAIVGGIGVIATLMEAKDELLPYRIVKFVSSDTPNKAASPSSDEGKEQFQTIVDQQCSIFLNEVARLRKVPVEKVQTSYGQGRCFVAQQALEAGLIEEVDKEEELSATATSENPITQGDIMPDMTEEEKVVELSPEEKISKLEERIAELEKLLEETLPKEELPKEEAAVQPMEEELPKEELPIDEEMLCENKKLKATIEDLQMKAAIEPLLIKGLITPAMRGQAELAWKAEHDNPIMKLFSTFYANKEVPVIDLNSRVSHSQVPLVDTRNLSEGEQMIEKVNAYCVSNGLNPNGPDFAHALLVLNKTI